MLESGPNLCKMDPSAKKCHETEIKSEFSNEDNVDSLAMEEGHAEDSDELFCDFEAVTDVVKKDSWEDNFEFNDECEEKSGSVVVMLPIKDEDITEVKEEVQDPLWMAGGC